MTKQGGISEDEDHSIVPSPQMTLGRGKHFQVAAATTSEAHLAFKDKSAVWCKFDFLDQPDPFTLAETPWTRIIISSVVALKQHHSQGCESYTIPQWELQIRSISHILLTCIKFTNFSFRLAFRRGVFRLFEERNIPASEIYWIQVLPTLSLPPSRITDKVNSSGPFLKPQKMYSH
jgi:hypothetical protein